jgi:hypothetical protein
VEESHDVIREQIAAKYYYCSPRRALRSEGMRESMIGIFRFLSKYHLDEKSYPLSAMLLIAFNTLFF